MGLTKHVYKLGVAEGTADDAIKALNDDGFAGESDWRLLNQQEVDDPQEADAVERLAKKEKMVDPNYYPKIRARSASSRSRSATWRITCWSSGRSPATSRSSTR